MEESLTWRKLLSRVIDKNPWEKQRIAKIVKVEPITIARWATGQSNPRQENAIALIEALPRYSQQMREALKKEYPSYFLGEDLPVRENSQEIPSAFYSRVINAFSTTPPAWRSWSVCSSVFRQIIDHMDPEQKGMLVLLAQCIPPGEDKKVRSLRITFGQGIYPWPDQIENYPLFLGAESQIGNALLSGHPITIRTREAKLQLFPTHGVGFEESITAFPILKDDCAAGCLLVMSTQRNYFTQARLDLLQAYAHLVALAFEPSDFYELDRIELGLMLPAIVQGVIFKDFHQRVVRKMIEANRDKKTISRAQAEVQVWQELERELLRRHLQQEAPDSNSSSTNPQSNG